MIVDPEALRVDTSIANLSLGVFHFVPLQKLQILIFKRRVERPRSGHVPEAYEASVTTLFCKQATFVIAPSD